MKELQAGLSTAANDGSADTVKRLILAGVDVNAGDYDQRTALHHLYYRFASSHYEPAVAATALFALILLLTRSPEVFYRLSVYWVPMLLWIAAPVVFSPNVAFGKPLQLFGTQAFSNLLDLRAPHRISVATHLCNHWPNRYRRFPFPKP